jgi:hypothetical protein
MTLVEFCDIKFSKFPSLFLVRKLYVPEGAGSLPIFVSIFFATLQRYVMLTASFILSGNTFGSKALIPSNLFAAAHNSLTLSASSLARR